LQEIEAQKSLCDLFALFMTDIYCCIVPAEISASIGVAAVIGKY